MSPHERMFNYDRRSTSGRSIPSWVKPGRVYVRNHTKRSKNDPPVTSATLVHANPEYAHIRLDSGVETTVNIRDLAPHPVETTGDPDDVFEEPNPLPVITPEINDTQEQLEQPTVDTEVNGVTSSNETQTQHDATSETPIVELPIVEDIPLRRTTRKTCPPVRFGDFVMD